MKGYSPIFLKFQATGRGQGDCFDWHNNDFPECGFFLPAGAYTILVPTM